MFCWNDLQAGRENVIWLTFAGLHRGKHLSALRHRAILEHMSGMQRDEILERLVAEGVASAGTRPEKSSTEQPPDHWSGPVLLERVAYLRKLARFSEGSASETIREFPGHSMTLSVMLRSGDAVIDEEHSHILTVLEGRATIVTGGILQRSKRVAQGEIRGTAISGGSSRELRTGDVVHLAPGMPHQILLAGDKSFSYLTVRIDQSATPGDAP